MKLKSSWVVLFTFLYLLYAQKPESGSEGVPGLLSGDLSDAVIKVEAAAVLNSENSYYDATVTIHNLLDERVELIADCGSFVSYRIGKEEGDTDSLVCAAVHSMLLPKKSAETFTLEIPPQRYKNGGLPLIVRYQLKQGKIEELMLELVPFDDNKVQ